MLPPVSNSRLEYISYPLSFSSASINLYLPIFGLASVVIIMSGFVLCYSLISSSVCKNISIRISTSYLLLSNGAIFTYVSYMDSDWLFLQCCSPFSLIYLHLSNSLHSWWVFYSIHTVSWSIIFWHSFRFNCQFSLLPSLWKCHHVLLKSNVFIFLIIIK